MTSFPHNRSARQPVCRERDDLLGRANYFGELRAPLRRKIAALASFETHPANHLLFAQNEAGRALYVVDTGLVEISRIVAGGRRLVLNHMGPGDVFGEVALLDGRERTASAQSIEPSTLFRIDRGDVMGLMLEDRAMALELIHVLCGRLRWISSQLEDHVTLPIRVRAAKKLLLLHERLNGEAQGIPVSQNDLASMIGATRESVNRVLSRWRAAGWITLERGLLRVEDPASLTRVVAEADAADEPDGAGLAAGLRSKRCNAAAN